MAEITDLNVFVGPPRQVRLGESVYLLPRDIPAELYLEFLDLQDRPGDVDDQAVIRKLHQDVLELFQVHDPSMTRLPPAVSIPVLVRMIGHVYSASGDVEERPTKPPSRGTTKRKPKPKPRSRSPR